MAQVRSELVRFFWNHMPRKYLEGALRGLFDCYEAADERCHTQFDRAEAVNILPFFRRGLIEGQLREIAASFPEITATPRRSPACGWNHTLVTCGRVALTQNAVGCPEDIVRPSLFRKMYAAKDNQQYLFPECKPEDPPPDSVLYGLLIHGHSGTPLFPAFAVIRFPKPDLKSYQPGQIDLFKEFPEIVRAKTEGLFEDQAVEQIAEPEPALRSDRREAGGGA